MNSSFPIDVSEFTPLSLDPAEPLSDADRAPLEANIRLGRDVIVFFTSLAEAKGEALPALSVVETGALPARKTTTEEWLAERGARKESSDG